MSTCPEGHPAAAGDRYCVVCGREVVRTSIPINSDDLTIGKGSTVRTKPVPLPVPTFADKFRDRSRRAMRPLRKLWPGAWPRGLQIGAALALVVAVAAPTALWALKVWPFNPKVTTLTVYMSVAAPSDFGCSSGSAFSPIPGSPVSIETADGRTVNGALGYAGLYSAGQCIFSAAVPATPWDTESYIIRVGEMTESFNQSEVEAAGWQVDFTTSLTRDLTIEVLVTTDGPNPTDLPWGALDIPGATVRVTPDGSNSTLQEALPQSGSAAGSRAAAFVVSFPGLPANQAAYTVSVGERPSVTFTLQEVMAADWSVTVRVSGSKN